MFGCSQRNINLPYQRQHHLQLTARNAVLFERRYRAGGEDVEYLIREILTSIANVQIGDWTITLTNQVMREIII